MLIVATAPPVSAHDGPPFPIVSDRVVGAYTISIWTDPDATDDGSAGGQFWVVLDRQGSEDATPADTRVAVSVRPLDREGPTQTATAEPLRGDAHNQFATLLLDHEGKFAVHVALDGPLGSAIVDSEVDATYDLRPPPYLIGIYLMPFVLVGLLWMRVLMRRRHARTAASRRS